MNWVKSRPSRTKKVLQLNTNRLSEVLENQYVLVVGMQRGWHKRADSLGWPFHHHLPLRHSEGTAPDLKLTPPLSCQPENDIVLHFMSVLFPRQNPVHIYRIRSAYWFPSTRIPGAPGGARSL